MKSKNVLLLSIFAVSVLLLSIPPQTLATLPAPPNLQIAWVHQLGSVARDIGDSIATDAYGNVFISGWTTGDFGGVNSGYSDAFIAKYNAEGTLEWTQQLGGNGYEESDSIATDLYGNVYIAGHTHGIPNADYSTGLKALLAKYDTNGNLLWTLANKTGERYAYGVATDAIGNVYITGNTNKTLEGETVGGIFDAFVAKYTQDGLLCWKQVIGTDEYDCAEAIAVDATGNVYITGDTSGKLGSIDNLGSADAFFTKFNTDGVLLWTQQFGTNKTDMGEAIAVDSEGNICIAGSTGGSLGGTNQGSWDAFLTKYDANGNQLWASLLGTNSVDSNYTVTVDPSDNIYIGGYTGGMLGDAQQGKNDAFLCQYDPDGNLLWLQQFGTDGNDGIDGITIDTLGNVFAVGGTSGSLSEPNVGTDDVFLIKFQSVPEPSSMIMISCLMLALGRLVKSNRPAKHRGGVLGTD